MKEQDQVQELTFENLMARLEEYVSELEKGGLSLDKAAEIYETGMMIAKEAGEKLEQAELRISKVQSEDG